MRRVILLVGLLSGCAEADPQAIGAGLAAQGQFQQYDQLRRQQQLQQLQQPFRPILVQPPPRPTVFRY
jgi:hypothetical protein